MHADSVPRVIVDYHMHLRNGRGEIAHEAAAVEPFVETARARGVDEIGFTEHVYYFRQTRPLWTVPYHVERCVYDIEEYVDAVVTAKERGLPVKLGLEVDYVPGREEETRTLLEPYPWDYLLGSIHWLDDFSTDSEPRLIDELGVEGAWRRYFEALAGAARSRLFDSLSHPDVLRAQRGQPLSQLEAGEQVRARRIVRSRRTAAEELVLATVLEHERDLLKEVAVADVVATRQDVAARLRTAAARS